MAEPTPVEPPPWACGTKGLCPRCGAPGLFAGVARFAPVCAACGLDFASFNVGDGPAAFLTLILGTIVTVMAITLELTVQPPFWVHILLWLPITIGAVVGSLRVAKGMLLAAEYRNAAREGRIDERP
ncbi:DUF983 domain-containing protein [Sphingomonas solaris]|uniref:DUF983 domain-containing protein n=1 Tax=Alterirhizorhabdus solaris TaxID=2529389 RepID=A0A558QVY2_9SPHN|nr:DUF983 domain-containing protein [Sphingomonas solaris]TVV71278.1 DUF983 domain-containing protein [Sphingomonas solaris]